MRCSFDRPLRLCTTIGVDTLERQRQPTALRIDLEDQHRHRVALRHDFPGILDVMLRELGDMDEAFDARQDSTNARR